MYLLSQKEVKYNIGKNLLFSGCFLLPTSGYIGPFLILLSCVLGSSLQGVKTLITAKMYPLYFLGSLMLISTLLSPFGLQSCGGIFNWLPFFWLFWSLSIYFQDKNSIQRVAMSLVYGTIPVLIIGFLHLIFAFDHSPRLFGSFIVWHMLDEGEFSGVFYNRNICAAWLAASFPFFVAAIRFQVYSREDVCKRVGAFFALFSISLAMIMTNSRNAIGSLIFGVFGMFADIASLKQVMAKSRFFASFIIALVISLVFFASSYFGLSQPVFNALGLFFADHDRLEIWKFGVQIASKNLFFGYGPGGFDGYVTLLSPFDRTFHHVHSLPLDLWVSYGLLALIVFVVYVFAWLFVAIRSGVMADSLFNRSWIVSFVLLMILHVTDLPYLDARINLVGWILFTGIVSCAESSVLKTAKPS